MFTVSINANRYYNWNKIQCIKEEFEGSLLYFLEEKIQFNICKKKTEFEPAHEIMVLTT